ncbi:hypothetical protein ACT8ZV_22725 [Nocardioides sp. MAHUQ-72]|uniref:hypothetical protein n=1 Tax=unclassified Nocardioides TaxID=2615069 RepID=UPI00361EC540
MTGVVLEHGGHAVLHLDPGTALAVVLLGVFHGVNPGMGWLFAVSFGLQERRRSAVLKALVPIGIGHEASVVVMAVAIVLFSSAVSQAVAVAGFGLALMGFGTYLFLKRRHFRWVGMRLTPFQLAWWSFLMSTVTGAGLMLAPVLIGEHAAGADELVSQALGGELEVALAAAALHAAAMVTTSAVVALTVYEVVRLRVLTRAWFNLDRVWALAFVAAGALVWVQ